VKTLRFTNKIHINFAGDNVIKLFFVLNLPKLLECLVLASLSSLALCLRVRPVPYPRVKPLNVLHLGKLRSFAQALELAGKACQGQTLKTNLQKIRKLRKKIYNTGPWFKMTIVLSFNLIVFYHF